MLVFGGIVYLVLDFVVIQKTIAFVLGINMLDDSLSDLPEYDTSGSEHPTPAQLLLRMAVERALMTKQRKVWEWYNYDRLTAVQIAKKLKIDPSSAARQIKTIEKQLTKWCQEHKEVYTALREAEANDSETTGC